MLEGVCSIVEGLNPKLIRSKLEAFSEPGGAEEGRQGSQGGRRRGRFFGVTARYMARKKKHEAHENHERWLVSYADFITLLFAFFVVMFASSQADKSKAQKFSEAAQRSPRRHRRLGHRRQSRRRARRHRR